MKVAFVHIPKTGGASVQTWLTQNRINNQKIGHLTLNERRGKNLPTEYDKSFTIVRNTYSRMLSLYNWGKHKIPKSIWRAKKKNNTEILENYYYPQQKAWDKGIVYYIDYCVDHQLRNVKNQLDFIEDVDMLLSYENLEEEFKQIQTLVNCNVPLTQRIHTYKDKTITNYSTEYIKCIQRHFANDIDYFKYKV
jgi:hypothetical protein